MSESATEWKTVTKSDKKRVMRRKRQGGRKINLDTTAVAANIAIIQDKLEDAKVLSELIAACRDLIVETNFWQNLVQLFDTYLKLSNDGCTKDVTIICLGIGNFSQTSVSNPSAPLWQLVLSTGLNEIVRQCGGSKIAVKYFDPCTTQFEKNFLINNLGVEVLDENTRGVIESSSSDNTLIYFMPHCPQMLYENVVWSMWDAIISSCRVLLIGNSLVDICDSLQKHNCDCIRATLPFIQQYELNMSKNDLAAMPGNFLGAFNDTYITWWRSTDDSVSTIQIPYSSISDRSESNNVNDELI